MPVTKGPPDTHPAAGTYRIADNFLAFCEEAFRLAAEPRYAVCARESVSRAEGALAITAGDIFSGDAG